jgi:hypothetical protein
MPRPQKTKAVYLARKVNTMILKQIREKQDRNKCHPPAVKPNVTPIYGLTKKLVYNYGITAWTTMTRITEIAIESALCRSPLFI